MEECIAAGRLNDRKACESGTHLLHTWFRKYEGWIRSGMPPTSYQKKAKYSLVPISLIVKLAEQEMPASSGFQLRSACIPALKIALHDRCCRWSIGGAKPDFWIRLKGIPGRTIVQQAVCSKYLLNQKLEKSVNQDQTFCLMRPSPLNQVSAIGKNIPVKI